MTDQPKKENGQETDTAPTPADVIKVDFGSRIEREDDKLTAWVQKEEVRTQQDVSVQVYMVEEAGLLGLHFSHPVDDFRMDVAGADQFISALVAAFMKLKEGA